MTYSLQYSDIFDPPMDLMTVKCTLEQNGYLNPIEFCKDVQLIFSYAKAYCPNKRVKVCFAMCLLEISSMLIFVMMILRYKSISFLSLYIQFRCTE